MPRYIDVDVLWRDVTSNIEDCGDVLEIIERQPVVTINDTSEENKVTKCNHIAEGSKKVSSQSEPNCSESPNSSDCISRQDAIDLWDKYHPYIATKAMEYDRELRALPSAQPEKRTEERTETHACDLIDREAAVDAIYHHLPSVSRTRARTMLHEVPSAQPEIIRCKDCKNWDTTWTNDFSPNYHYCPMVDGVRKEDWYCADAERRTDG